MISFIKIILLVRLHVHDITLDYTDVHDITLDYTGCVNGDNYSVLTWMMTTEWDENFPDSFIKEV